MALPTIPLAGYADRLSVRPGETIAFKVSSAGAGPYTADLVRIVCADPNPEGPGRKEETVAAAFAGSFPSRAQNVPIGSYAIVAEAGALDRLTSFTALATIWPTRPGKGEQGLIARWDPTSGAGFALGLGENGDLVGIVGAGHGQVPSQLTMGRPLVEREWLHVWLSWNAATRTLALGQVPADRASAMGGVDDGTSDVVEETLARAPVLATTVPLLLAALSGNPTGASPVTGHYTGKLERPRLFSRALTDAEISDACRGKDVAGLAADWNFAWQIPSADVSDLGPHNLMARLVNCPTRAMTGSTWTGAEHCWRHAPDHYGAIHFHDDDLADCGWPTDFSWVVPEGTRSGVYTARLRCGEQEERIPFVVCPPKGVMPKARICVLISTFTYIVYGNHARPSWPNPRWRQMWQDRAKAWNGYPHNPGAHRGFGLSTYNFHTDGSGIAYASLLRPMLNVRPGYITYPEDIHGSGLRHFPADTHLTAWLEAKGYDYDVITDWELHTEGADVLKPYQIVLTGSHPEYHTTESLDALQGYRDGGGRFCYLGGNGFYWKVAVSSQWPGVVEIRRGEGGIRAWAAEPGEYYNAFDGQYGGLWRRNGRPPQNLTGVGFTAQGDFVGSYYRTRPEAKDPRVAWMFAGIAGDKIGDFGLSGRGAAGFELDRTDKRLGTPRHALVVAASEGHAPEAPWVLVPEEMLTHITTITGEKASDLIRADLTFFETPAGGAVFSTGSIAFCGSLPWNGFNNDVSRLLGNVVDRFLDPAPFAMPEG